MYIDNLRMEVEHITTSIMLYRLDQFAANGAFANDQALRAINVHLTAIQMFEQTGQAEKIVQHMSAFHTLLDNQLDKGLITEEAYDYLKADTEAMIALWTNKGLRNSFFMKGGGVTLNKC